MRLAPLAAIPLLAQGPLPLREAADPPYVREWVPAEWAVDLADSPSKRTSSG